MRGCGGSSGLAGRLVHGGEGRVRRLRQRSVVEPDHRDVLRHPAARLVQHSQGAGRHQVVGAEDPVHVGSADEQVAHPGLAALLTEVTVHHEVLVDLHVVGGEPVAVPLEAGAAGHHVGRAGDGRDPATSAVDQVVDGQPGTERVVHVDERHVHVVGAAATQDDGQPARADPLRQPVVVVERDQEHAVDVLAGEVVVEVSTTLRLREHQHQLQVALGQGRADAPDHPGEEGLAEDPLLGLRDHQRDRVGALGDQSACGRVGDVAQLGDRLLHGLACPVGDLRPAVDHPGGGAAADAGQGCDLLQRGAGARRPAHGLSMPSR
jgi:hypothetical protein